jgi:hypothetical protein
MLNSLDDEKPGGRLHPPLLVDLAVSIAVMVLAMADHNLSWFMQTWIELVRNSGTGRMRRDGAVGRLDVLSFRCGCWRPAHSLNGTAWMGNGAVLHFGPLAGNRRLWRLFGQILELSAF